MAEGEGGRLGRLIKIIVAVVLLALLAVGAYIGYLFLATGHKGSQATPPPSSETNYLANPHYLALGDFVVNLADGRRYLKTNLQLLISDQKAADYLQVRLAEVKDLVISELETWTAEQLRDPRNQAVLKQHLLTKIESLLPPASEGGWKDPKPIKKVLITEFYLQ